MSLTLSSAAATEPLTLTEAKLHLRVDHTTDDTPITALIVAARQYAESFTRRALITQTWSWKADSLSEMVGIDGVIRLPLAPLVSVSSVTYTDTNGTGQTWAATEYIVDAPAGNYAQRGRIALAYGESWPTTRGIINAVTITFVAGYGAASAVPQQIKQAMYLMIGHQYENREDVTLTGRGEMVTEIPKGTDALLWPFRVFA